MPKWGVANNSSANQNVVYFLFLATFTATKQHTITPRVSILLHETKELRFQCNYINQNFLRFGVSYQKYIYYLIIMQALQKQII